MKSRSLLCCLLALILLLCPLPALAFSDTGGHWAEESIQRWSGCGVVNGYSDGSFGPSRSISRGEMASLLDQVFGWKQQSVNNFSDVPNDKWYAGPVLRANAAGVLQGSNGMARPTDPISRQEAAVMLTRALRLSQSGGGGVQFTDSDKIGDWAQNAIDTLSAHGFISGGPDGSFAPLRTITRAEVVAILDRSIANYIYQAGSYSSASPGMTLVAASGVTLRDMALNGDLLIAPGAAGSEVVLQNVSVTGRTLIQTDQEAHIVISGGSLQTVEVTGVNARILLSENTQVAQITVTGHGASLRGLPANMQVSVGPGVQQVTVNGHGVAENTTVAAGQDISDEWDGVIVEIIIVPADSGTTPGGTTPGGTTPGGTTPGGTTPGGTTPGGTTPGGTTPGGTTPGGTTPGGTTPGGTTPGGTTPGSGTTPPDPPAPPPAYTGYVDENGNIILKFEDLLKLWEGR